MTITAIVLICLSTVAFITVTGLVLIDIAQRIRDRIRARRKSDPIAEWEESYW